MLYNVGLILEGGGIRCLYTAGVLDFLLGRTLRITRDYIRDRRYCSLLNLLTTYRTAGGRRSACCLPYIRAEPRLPADNAHRRQGSSVRQLQGAGSALS